jgi:cation-transporting ATPase E
MSDGAGRPDLSGLTQAEVAERVAAGKSNVNTDVKTKSVKQIIAEHTFTLFNGVMVVLAVLVWLTGDRRNMLFIFPVVCNLIIGTFQEIRSKIVIDRLSVLASRGAVVIRDGAEQTIPLDEIVIDDLVVLGRGDQVPADAVIVDGEGTVDESLLTGESFPVTKDVGDELLSGSFLDSGRVICRVVRVGSEGFAARINAGAKKAKRVESEILYSLNFIIRVATFLLVPLGLGLFLRTLFKSGSVAGSILTTVSAVVGMIPQGLVLLTSAVFALASTSLARHKVLVQQMYCIEMLARVDVLCLDKTGTITTGAMEMTTARPAPGVDASELDQALADIVASDRTRNATSSAIRGYVEKKNLSPSEIARSIDFSSSTKRSGCVTADGRAYVIGAAQFIFGDDYERKAPDLKDFEAMIRAIVVCSVDGFDEEGELIGEPRLLGYVALEDEIRPTAAETIEYFREQGVTIDVISGDDPRTVSAIAQRVGIPGADEYVDASTLKTDEDVRKAAERCHVFGRVTPDQKLGLVNALKAQGHTVAMTGDGVNDVLALRNADCSIAMASGSDAARNVAELVLVDNDFAHMPAVVAEGRRSINNLQRSASLFLVRTVFSALLALICIFWPPYPFLPIQMTLVSSAVIGVPSCVLALEPNHDRVTGGFLANVLRKSLPASFGIICGLVLAILTCRLLGWSRGVTSTICMIVVAVVGIALIIRIAPPTNPLRVALLVVVVGIMVVGCTVLGWVFYVSALDFPMVIDTLACCALGIYVFQRCYCFFEEHTLDALLDKNFIRKLGGHRYG